MSYVLDVTTPPPVGPPTAAQSPEPPRPLLLRLRQWARAIKRDVHAIYLASRDPRVPWYAKVVALVVAGYALSPIDLIPDFIPVLGFLDDVILVPAGVLLVRRLIPPEIFAEHRAAAERASERPLNRSAAAVIVAIWFGAAALTLWFAWPVVAARLAGSPPRAQ